MDPSKPQLDEDCCKRLFFAHRVGGETPLIVLECCLCGRLWHRCEDSALVPYDRELLAAVRDAT